jgi:hypothetical protein
LYLQRNILHALAKQLFFLCLAYSQNSFAQSFKVMASEQTIAKILSGKRAQKKLEASATSMISSFNTAANTATEAELEWISNTLRLNMTLMYRIAGMLKNDALISLLDGTLAVDDPGESELPPAKRPRVSLRASIKKFKHLSQAIGLPFAVLYHLEPSVFHTELDWGDCDLIGILARAVGANRETDLPSKHFHGIECVPSLKQALKLRYNELDSLYTNMSPEMIKKGIYQVKDAGKTIVCLMKITAPLEQTESAFPEISFGENASYIRIDDRFDPASSIHFKMNERALTMTDVKGSFEKMGVVFNLSSAARWVMQNCFVLKIVPSSPSNGGRVVGAVARLRNSQSGSRTASSQYSVAGVLHRRIAEKKGL